MSDIQDFVVRAVAKAFDKDVSEISLELNLLDDLDAKSVQYFPIMNALEDEYDLDLQYQKFRIECTTVGDIIKLVEREVN